MFVQSHSNPKLNSLIILKKLVTLRQNDDHFGEYWLNLNFYYIKWKMEISNILDNYLILVGRVSGLFFLHLEGEKNSPDCYPKKQKSFPVVQCYLFDIHRRFLNLKWFYFKPAPQRILEHSIQLKLRHTYM